MNPRNTGILLLVALAFGAYLYFVEVGGEDARRDAEANSKRMFPELEGGDIEWIALQTADGEARLEREEQSWRLVVPIEFPADAIVADGLATSLAELAWEAQLEDASSLAEYGLDADARRVRFGVGETEYSVRFGRETPIGPNSYAQREGDDGVVTLPTFRARSFDKSLLDLRDKRILDFDMAAVSQLEARWPDGGVGLSKHVSEGEPSWSLDSPLDARADFETVRDLLATLSFLRAENFVDEPDEVALAGFETPFFEVSLRLDAEEGEEPRTLTLAIGGLHEGDQRLVRGGRKTLYTVPADRFADLPRRVIEYRFRKLAEFEIGDAQQLDLYFQPESGDPVAVNGERGTDGWTSSPEKMAPGKLSRLVSELSSLEAGDILAETEANDLAALGLAPPHVILTVLGAAPEAGGEGEGEGEGDEESAAATRKLAEIHLGNVEGSEWIMARTPDDANVYRLDYELAEHLPVSLDAFRSRFLAEEAAEPEADPDGLDLSPSEESP